MSRSYLHQALLASALLAVPLLAPPAMAASAPDSSAVADTATPGPIINTAYGQVQGIVDYGVNNFRGIPYALPPVGHLRWTDPQPPDAWTGVRSGAKFGNACSQGRGAMGVGVSEDCLYLNVQSPLNATATSNLPVMVWIHGGDLTGGSGFEYNGTNLVTEDNVIFVSINYRLGYLGFLALPPLTHENPHHRSGNYGLLDQQAAVAWVRQNIANFGGNPNQITIFGESAGALSVITQLASPTLGPIHSMISESGTYMQRFASLSEAESAGVAISAGIGCTDQKTLMACMRKVPAQTLVDAVTGNDITNRYNPGVNFNIDHYALTEQPYMAFLHGNFQQVPVIVGTNHDETRLFISEDDLTGTPPFTAQSYEQEIKSLLPGALRHYPVTKYWDPNYAAAAVSTDYAFSCPAYILYDYLSQHTKVYAYELDDQYWPNGFMPYDKYMPWLGDPHAADLTYIFPRFWVRVDDEPPTYSRFSPNERVLASTMREFWTSLATTGTPVNKHGLTWPSYDPKEVNILSLVPPKPTRLKDFYKFHHCDFWTDFLLKQDGFPLHSVH